jgi:hypothetical protein
MTDRHILPARRACETFEMTHGAQNTAFQVTVGFFAPFGERQIGEVFITGAKTGSDFEAVARDGAILLSLCLQHGVPLQTIAGALTRNENGDPSTVIGAVVDRLSGNA